ncbi:hypothetical protein V491_02659 [Pseudogymnoascus sp. VKM F-3775]|nr:hypothetical protein V491_02659 [Pseudogymnoascus sp. VKM F-3775]
MENRVYKPPACHSHLEILNTRRGNSATDIESYGAGSPGYSSLKRNSEEPLHHRNDGNCDVETSRDVNANINKIQQDEAQLTRRNLALFNKMTTGEVPGDESESTLLEFTTQTTTIKSKSASATMSSFANKAYKNGILPPYNSKPPTNLDERYEQAVKSRETASPTVAEYGSYVRTLPRAFNELARGNKALPHIAGEYRGPGGNMGKARLQCAYGGAALVYARNKALALIRKPDPLGRAEITTFATDGKIIDFFAHYAAQGNDDKLKYHQYPIGSCVLTASPYGFKDGWRQLQNQQDYAREQSYSLRDYLVNYWQAREGIASSISLESGRIGDLSKTRHESWQKTQTIQEGVAQEEIKTAEMVDID